MTEGSSRNARAHRINMFHNSSSSSLPSEHDDDDHDHDHHKSSPRRPQMKRSNSLSRSAHRRSTNNPRANNRRVASTRRLAKVADTARNTSDKLASRRRSSRKDDGSRRTRRSSDPLLGGAATSSSNSNNAAVDESVRSRSLDLDDLGAAAPDLSENSTKSTTTRRRSSSLHRTILAGATLELQILQAKDVTERRMNPYVTVFLPDQGVWKRLGQTSTTKSVSASLLQYHWNETLRFELGCDLTRTMLRNGDKLECRVYHHQSILEDEFLGCSLVPLLPPSDTNRSTPQWHRLLKRSPNAPALMRRQSANFAGQLQVQVNLHAFELTDLYPNEYMVLEPNQWTAGVTWKPTVNRDLVLECSCIAVDQRGEIRWSDCVYFNQFINASRTGAWRMPTPHQVEIQLDLQNMPEAVVALYLVAHVMNDDLNFADDVQGFEVKVWNTQTQIAIARFRPPFLRSTAACVLLQWTRHGEQQSTSSKSGDDTNNNESGGKESKKSKKKKKSKSDKSSDKGGGGDHDDEQEDDGEKKLEMKYEWRLAPVNQFYPLARDFGSLLPQLKSLSYRVLKKSSDQPFKINPLLKIAPLRAAGRPARLQDYCTHHSIYVAMAWQQTPAQAPPLNAYGLLMDIEKRRNASVWSKDPEMRDGSLMYNITPENNKLWDQAEKGIKAQFRALKFGANNSSNSEIHLKWMEANLDCVTPRVESLCFGVAPLTSQGSSVHITNASLHFFDAKSGQELARHLRAEPPQTSSALLMGHLYKYEPEWHMYANFQPAEGASIARAAVEWRTHMEENPPLKPWPAPTLTKPLKIHTMPADMALVEDERVDIPEGQILKYL